MSDYQTAYLDTEKPIEYLKQSVSTSGDFETTTHRPEREGKPWKFDGMEGISEDAYADTGGQCVPYQLARHIKIKGGREPPPYTQEEIAQQLIDITQELYENDPDSPYQDADILSDGFTPAAYIQLCNCLL